MLAIEETERTMKLSQKQVEYQSTVAKILIHQDVTPGDVSF